MAWLENYHTHTTFSDGANTVDQMVQAAVDRGMSVIGFSDHSKSAWSPDFGMQDEAAYRAAVAAAKNKYADKISVLCGIEQEWISGKVTGYDYVIGSVHLIKTPNGYADVDNTAAIQRETVNTYFSGDVYRYTKAYFDTVATVNETVDPTVIGHFDLVSKFNEREHLFDETDTRYLTPAIEAIHTLCEKKGTVFEINTGALPRGARRTPYPAPVFLKEIKAAGGRILFSSDSHKAETLLFGEEAVRQAARDAGFTSRVIIRADGRLAEIGL